MGFLKHALKLYDNRSDRQFDIVEIVYDFSMSRATRALQIACDNRKQKSCDFCSARCSRHEKIVYDFYDIIFPVATIVVGF